MNVADKLDNFRNDNPFDIGTQAKRLMATEDKELIMYVIELGLALAKQRERHEERQHMKDTGFTRPKEKLVMKQGRVTGSIIIKPGKRGRNAMQRLLLDTWHINGEQKLGDASAADLGEAIKRETVSAKGHEKNAQFYSILKKPLHGREAVREKWSDDTIRPEIEAVYGEFRRTEAA